MTLPRCLRLAITVDPEIPVPPDLYGGIERIVDMLVRGLVERGHQITLFANPDSRVPCKLEAYGGLRSQQTGDLLRNMWHVSAKVLVGRFDLVHSFARLAYLLPILPARVPKIMSYQRLVGSRSVAWGNRLSRGTLHFAGCSQHITRAFAADGNWDVIYNGAPLNAYQFRESVAADAPLVFLGRVEEIKGAHLAIETALRGGRRLVIAGNVPDAPHHQSYFREKVLPHIDDKRICYMGPVNDVQKNELLGAAAALLMPILWEEPFGIVMAEALACGTPVIGLRRGSVPEVVEHGVNGFVCNSAEEMIKAVEGVQEIDRRECRRIMEEKFSDRAMIEAYEALYAKVLRY